MVPPPPPRPPPHPRLAHRCCFVCGGQACHRFRKKAYVRISGLLRIAYFFSFSFALLYADLGIFCCTSGYAWRHLFVLVCSAFTWFTRALLDAVAFLKSLNSLPPLIAPFSRCRRQGRRAVDSHQGNGVGGVPQGCRQSHHGTPARGGGTPHNDRWGSDQAQLP